MPICKFCGSTLAENEVCECRNGEASPPLDDQKKIGTPKRKVLNPLIITLIILIAIGLLGAGVIHTMNGYTYGSRLASANSAASSLYKSVNAALIEMKDNGYSVNGYYLVCSNRDKNVNLPEDFDEDEFYRSVENFFYDSTKIQWFAVIENDTAVYAASSQKWKHTLLGTYPDSGYDYLYYYDTGSETTKKRDKATLKAQYDDTAKKVRANAEDEEFIRELITSAEQSKE